MRPFVAACCCAAAIAVASWAQDPQILIETYTRNFRQAPDDDTRLGVVRDAVSLHVHGLGPFHETVVRYAVQKVDQLAADSQLQEMALLSVAAIGEDGYQPALSSVWELCRKTTSPEMRIAAFAALGRIGQRDARTASEMAALLDAQNRVFASGQSPEIQLVYALVRTLGEMGDSVALRALFTTRSLPYPAFVNEAANNALLSIHGGLQAALLRIIEGGMPPEKEAALILGLQSGSIDRDGRAAVAAAALKSGLALIAQDAETQAIAREMRTIAADALAGAKWPTALDLGLEHFGRAIAELGRGAVDNSYLIAAIRSIGASGRREAAERLTLYLELINSYAERRQPYDEKVLVTVIDTLGRMGDPVAFANLSYAKYMPYSTTVQNAVKQAIASLKW